jgi:regulator of protease activity HflC (stomatin/prohibitin superfamily)
MNRKKHFKFNNFNNFNKGNSMSYYSSTNSVQSFIRFLAWIVSMIVLTVLLGGFASVISMAIFDSGSVLFFPTLLFNAWVSSILAKMFYILPEWERMVLLRLGQFVGIKGPGYFIIPPFVYSVAAIVDTRIETHQVEATATLTKDNVPTKVTAAVEFKIEDPRKAVIDVQNYRQSVVWLSTEALKNTIGSMDLRELLSERDQIADNLKDQIDTGAAVYGIDVKAVRITDIDTPQSLVEELAVIARARRAAEAKRIEAEMEITVADKIREASTHLDQSKHGMRLREMQLLSEMSKEESSTIIVYPYGDETGRYIASGSAGSFSDNQTPRKMMPEKIQYSRDKSPK